MNTDKLRVLKFGGSSVATPELVRQVASIVKKERQRTPRLVVVVSAMGKTTDQLIKLASEVSPNSAHYRRETDMLLTTGERISMALLSMALEDQNIPSISFTGSQSGIITDGEHGEARIVEIRPQRILDALESGKVVIVAGFQGVSRNKEITTLGRGGSDTSAVALGAALKAEQVDIYTDVDGFYTADPRKVPMARKLVEIPLREAYLAASRGAKVLHARCLEIAYRHKTPVRVLSTFKPEAGGSTIVDTPIKTLEGPQVLQICRQDSLSIVRIPAAQALELEDTPAADYLDLKNNATHCTLLLSPAQKLRWMERFQSKPDLRQRIENSDFPISRVSLIGSGLDQASEISGKIAMYIRELSIEKIEEHRSESLMDYLVKDSSGIDALTQRLHQEFIEKESGRV